MKETEEIIEARLIELLSERIADIEILGALSPALEGEVKSSPDTHIDVIVDLAGQDMDWRSSPCVYTATVTLHYSNAEDSSGVGFRDACRFIRSVFRSLMGDGCSGLSSDGFECDALTLDSTSTSVDQESEYGGGMIKTYTATIHGRTN